MIDFKVHTEVRESEMLCLDSCIMLFIKRIIYIVCFSALCLIDQIIGSATGSIQYGIKHYTGVIIAIIILTAYKPRDFFKIPYFVWLILFFITRYFILEWAFTQSISYMRLNTFLWNIGIFGIVFIRFFYCWFVEKRKPQINVLIFVFWLLMIIGMILIRKDYSWLSPLLLTYFCFYLTEIEEKDLNNLYSGMIEGIILGFFLIQCQAWMYRPYDRTRYYGMYSHPNMNALLYVCAYFSVLAKWYWMKLKRKNMFLRIPWILLAGLIVGTCIFTGSRTAFLTMMVITFLFLITQFLSCKKRKFIELVVDVVSLVMVIIICFLPAYVLIRYVPSYVDEPTYFEGDVVSERIQKGDSIDSEKYTEFDEALEVTFGRYFWFEKEAVETDSWWRSLYERLNLRLSVQAADLVENELIEDSEEYIEPGTDRNHLLKRTIDEDVGWYDVRLDIYKYFMNKLTLIGNEGNAQGVWVANIGFAAHCHNIYLQFAYDFGIIIGVMFIIVTLFPFIRVLVGLFQKKSGAWYYRLFVTLGFSTILVVFGMLEINWIYGQLPFTMFWIVQYPVYHKQPFEVERAAKKKATKVQALAEKKLIVEELDSAECEWESLEDK